MRNSRFNIQLKILTKLLTSFHISSYINIFFLNEYKEQEIIRNTNYKYSSEALFFPEFHFRKRK